MKNLFNKLIKLVANKCSENNSEALFPTSPAAAQVQNELNAWTMTFALRRLSAQGFTFSTILDVGASDGKWTKDVLTIFPEAQYLLFEPLAERSRELELLRESFSNVDFVLAAVGSAPGEVELFVTEDLDGSRALLDHETNAANRKVPLVTIDHAIGARKLPPAYLLKLDVHGYELPILSGAAATLHQTRIVIIEAYNFHITAASPTFVELVLHMDKLGFYCIDIADPLRMSNEGFEWQVDLFFARKNDPAFAGKNLRF